MRWTPFRLSVCLAWYCSKYTNRKTVDQRKSKFTKQEDSYCKCDQFCVDTFSLPVSLAATGAVPIPIPRALTRFCRFSFVACRDVHHLLFLIFEWMDRLVADDACYIIRALFSDRLLVSSWCLVSSRSKCGIAFVWSDSAVRIVRARQCFTMVAGWWLCLWRVWSWHHGCMYSLMSCLSRHHWTELLFDVQWSAHLECLQDVQS